VVVVVAVQVLQDTYKETLRLQQQVAAVAADGS
jgi:hypothetical protein